MFWLTEHTIMRQYKILNAILYTNAKLCKIGYIAEDKHTFCESESETLIHLFFNCVYSKLFCTDFEFDNKITMP